MGGVGKTTLAKHINNRFLQQSEERVIWVTVSQAFTIKKLQDEIARDVRVDLSHEENEDKRAARLWRALSGRNNILILDDVWENINLEKVGYPLSEEGFRLIITTRSVEVCRRIGCKEVIVMKTLPKDEAWKLFSETLGKETKLAPQVEKIAKRIAEMCDGLPLGIIVLAGSMRGETTIHFWRDALRELEEYSVVGQDVMEDEVFKVLKYSFDRLDPNNRRQGLTKNVYNPLQLCFLYCCLYPEDAEISKEGLVEKFISEGLMDEKRSRRVQVDQGSRIIKRGSRRALVDRGRCMVDKLVNVCLLESCTDRLVKMHDLVRSMALKITEGTTMVVAGHSSLKEIPNEEEWTKDLEKVSLMRNGIEQIPSGISPNCPKLSTLLFSDNPLMFLADSFFSKMQGLCTLDLSNSEIIEKLPDSLSTLQRLKVLLLRCCWKLVYVPYLGNLKALTELDLTETAIKELPQGTEELVHLKYLAINVKRLEFVRSGLLLRFPNLQSMEFPDHIAVPMGEVEKIKQVEVFRGRVKNVGDLNRFFTSRVSEPLFGIGVGSVPLLYEKTYNNGVMLCNYKFNNGEENCEAVLGDYIERLSIRNCVGLSSSLLDDFQGLLRLKLLEITECGGIECIMKGEQLMKEVHSQVFSTLEKKGIVTSAPSRQALFSSLRILLISGCPKMKKLGLAVAEFPILEELSVSGCLEIEEIVEVGEGEARFVSLPKLRKLELLDLPKLKKLGLPVSGFPNLEEFCVLGSSEIEEIFVEAGGGEGGLVSSLPKLRKLNLINLPSLKSICNKGRVICGSIKTIHLISCLSLKIFPLEVVPPPPSLRQIKIGTEQEWASMEWEDPTHPLLLQPFLRFV